MSTNDRFFSEPTEDLRRRIEMDERWREVEYAVCMYRLQSRLGLSFKEARAFLSTYKESFGSIAADYGITVQAVHNLYRRAEKKFREGGCTQEELYGEFLPDLVLTG